MIPGWGVYATWIRSLCSKSENNNHLSLAEARAGLSLAKYLGDWISTDGLADSVKVTVSKRFGLVHRAIADIRVIVDDCRNCIIGGLATGLHIWEAAVLPGLLFNSECWIMFQYYNRRDGCRDGRRVGRRVGCRTGCRIGCRKVSK